MNAIVRASPMHMHLFAPSRLMVSSGIVGASAPLAAGLALAGEYLRQGSVAIGLDALLNRAAKVEAFSGHAWNAPLVVRAACGGGYGDGGQHMQSLWGLLAGIPGLAVVVPSTPAGAAGLMRAAIEDDRPVVYLEHKLLSDWWLDSMGGLHREAPPTFDVPPAGARGEVQLPVCALPIGRAAVQRRGS